MVDVMLVLLIVFMVAAPLLTVGVPVNCRKRRLESLSGDDDFGDKSIQADGQVFVQDTRLFRQMN